MRFSLVGALLAGGVGTVVLSLLFYVPAIFLLPAMDIFDLFGSFFPLSGGWTLAVGAGIHAGIGIGTAVAWALLWRIGIGAPTWRIGLLFGIFNGIAAVATYQLLFALLPDPPAVYMSWGKTLVVLLSFAAYGGTVSLVYCAFVSRQFQPAQNHL